MVATFPNPLRTKKIYFIYAPLCKKHAVKDSTSSYFYENNCYFDFPSGRRVSIGELVFSQNIVGIVMMVGENGKAGIPGENRPNIQNTHKLTEISK